MERGFLYVAREERSGDSCSDEVRLLIKVSYGEGSESWVVGDQAVQL